MTKCARNKKYKILNKLFEAGITDEKAIAEFKVKDMSKIKGLTKKDMQVLAKLQQVISECKNINPLLKFLSNSEMEVE